jgi:hypothetical protein
MEVIVAKTVELPHVISYRGKEYRFAPACDVPEDLGEALLKNKGHMFSKAPEGKVSTDGYTWTDQFKNKSIQDIVGKLPEEDKLKVYDLAKKLYARASEKKEKPKEEAPK